MIGPFHSTNVSIVSAYVFHEFDLSTKISLLKRLAHDHLTDGGRIIIGDIAFPTVQAREEAHQRWLRIWDEGEHYWAADEATTACEKAGLQLRYTQVSSLRWHLCHLDRRVLRN